MFSSSDDVTEWKDFKSAYRLPLAKWTQLSVTMAFITVCFTPSSTIHHRKDFRDVWLHSVQAFKVSKLKNTVPEASISYVVHEITYKRCQACLEACKATDML